jgi:hypothetical protein
VQTEQQVETFLTRNWACVEEILKALCQPPLELTGEQVKDIVFAHADEVDVQKLKAEECEFM